MRAPTPLKSWASFGEWQAEYARFVTRAEGKFPLWIGHTCSGDFRECRRVRPGGELSSMFEGGEEWGSTGNRRCFAVE